MCELGRQKPTKGYYSKRDQGANCTKQCNSNEVSKELFLLHLEPGLGKEKKWRTVSELYIQVLTARYSVNYS